jgi:hypothetical protein
VEKALSWRASLLLSLDTETEEDVCNVEGVAIFKFVRRLSISVGEAY